MPLLNIIAIVLHFIAMLNAYGEKQKNVSNAKGNKIKYSLIPFVASAGGPTKYICSGTCCVTTTAV
jgi:hypothetical protein